MHFPCVWLAEPSAAGAGFDRRQFRVSSRKRSAVRDLLSPCTRCRVGPGSPLRCGGGDTCGPMRNLLEKGAMKRLAFALAVLAAACSVSPQAAAPTDPTVARIETGDLKGVQTGDVIAFKGVPYAAPPVGDLRWRAPQPAAKWQGVRDALAHGAICMQKMPNPDNGIGQYPASEDCLTLGVWTTTLDRNAKQPVMLWIHGGGFVNGSGSADLYDGS